MSVRLGVQKRITERTKLSSSEEEHSREGKTKQNKKTTKHHKLQQGKFQLHTTRKKPNPTTTPLKEWSNIWSDIQRYCGIPVLGDTQKPEWTVPIFKMDSNSQLVLLRGGGRWTTKGPFKPNLFFDPMIMF